MKSELKIPKQIFQLIDLGIWPRTETESNKQHRKSIIPINKLKEFAPEENSIYLYPFPFVRISDELLKDNDYWNKYGAIHQIDPELALIIGDFGIGSDTCLILDYRENKEEPNVYRLVFIGENQNYWTKVADNFAAFCHITGLNIYLL